MTPEERYYANSDEGEIRRVREQLRIATEALGSIADRGGDGWFIADDALTRMSTLEPNRCPHGHTGCCGHHDLADMPIHSPTARSDQ